jgi:hypothetical protein
MGWRGRAEFRWLVMVVVVDMVGFAGTGCFNLMQLLFFVNEKIAPTPAPAIRRFALNDDYMYASANYVRTYKVSRTARNPAKLLTQL